MTARTAGIVVFTALLVAAVGIDGVARRGRAMATAGEAVAAAMRTTPGRFGVLAVWVWLGVHFLAR